MYSTGIIIFREVLEIAIIISVIMAATRGLSNRIKLILIGVMGGVLGSGIVAFFADKISDSFSGSGQEIFNAIVLFAAVFLLGWTVIWMKTHGRQIAEHIKKVGKGVVDGELPLYSISVVVGLAVLREGSEIVLFMFGILASGKDSLIDIMIGGGVGFLAGAAIGVMIYLGLIKVSTKHLFGVTSWLLAFLAAGMAAQGAAYLIAAGILPSIVDTIWDTSHILSEENIIGKIMHGLVGYSDRPSAMQLIFYTAVLFVISALLIITDKKNNKNKPA